MYSFEIESAVLLRNNITLLRTCESEDGFYFLTTGDSLKCFKNCYKTMKLQWGSQEENMFRGKTCLIRIIPKYIFRRNFSFLPSFGINYFSTFYGRKKRKMKTSSLKSPEKQQKSDHFVSFRLSQVAYLVTPK